MLRLFSSSGFFQFFSQEIARILQEQNVACEVELDDFLILANLYGKCKKDVELVVKLLPYFGFKINFAKSCLIPSQTIDFLGYTLDAKNCCFVLTQEKLVKCRLIGADLDQVIRLGKPSQILYENCRNFLENVFTTNSNIIIKIISSVLSIYLCSLRNPCVPYFTMIKAI